jgi:arylsulfatase A-like enzyme
MAEKKTYPEEYTEKVFKGKIELDVRDSVADWGPYLPPVAPRDAPNVLFILYDDTGLAAWSPYGGRINMPTAQKLADNGLIYTQWHTTALCAPTRSTCLTGRSHHLNGFAEIVEGSNGYPGYHARIPAQCATIAHILQDAGWSTFWVGKNHNVPEQDNAPGGYKDTWPLQKGFDRFYGFLGGETSQWYPDLVEDNHFIDQPYLPEEGYHLSKDLADQAIRMIRDNKASNPSKPWYMWFCPGANHAPHQCPQEYIDKYKGKFDDGYEAYREWCLARMVEKGVMPEGTKLTPFNPMPEDQANELDYVLPWDTLSADQKKLFCRMAEVWAGFSEYTDAQIGRIIDYLEESGQLENTLVFYAADNGTSGEGSPNGSVNENKFFNGFPDDLEENMKMIDKLGGPDCYNHMPTGWAAAFSTPFKMFKRYSEYSGGTCDPLVISWPKGIKARGEVRHQYHHSADVAATILDVCGLEMPVIYRGVEQYPMSGVSMRYSFDADPDGPTQRKNQYYEMMGTRGMWEDGWHAAATHAPLTGKGHFDKDRWELYHVVEDRSESTDLAEKYPEKLEHLKQLWMDEARKNLVLPLNDEPPVVLVNIERPSSEPPRDRYVYYPDTTAVPEGVAANVRGRSYKILADVEVGDKTSGVIFAHGSRFGGHSLFINDKKLYYVYNFLGIPPEQKFISSEELKPGKYTLGVEFIREKAGQYGESHGTTRLYINDKVVAEGPMRTQTGKFTLCGDGLCIGRDSADAVAKEYTPETQGKFTGGTIQFVEVSVEKERYRDLEREMAAAMSVD